MKKFVIISIVLLLAAGTAFGFALKHYIDSTRPAQPEVENVTESAKNASANPEQPAPTSADAIDPLADGGIFSANYEKAKEAVQNMTTEEMAGQLIVGICSDTESGSADISQYGLAGFLFESDAFAYLSADEIKQRLTDLGAKAKIAPILAAQEEGGERNTVSDNGSFPENNYDSPRNIFASGGLQDVEKTELQKAGFLRELGFNLNFAPVVDMPDAYDQIMYSRSLSDDAETVSDFAKYCAKHIQAKGVSVVLKHFPGYGTIPDSAAYEAQANGTAVVDDRAADTIRSKDYEPFKAGAAEGAHLIMVSNVVVKNIDATHTAALSRAVHQELRGSVGFKGLAITDVIDDSDYSAYADGRNVAVAAILAGNDLILSRNYRDAHAAIVAAVKDGTIGEELIRQNCARVLAYKYTAGILK